MIAKHIRVTGNGLSSERLYISIRIYDVLNQILCRAVYSARQVFDRCLIGINDGDPDRIEIAVDRIRQVLHMCIQGIRDISSRPIEILLESSSLIR